MNQHNEHAIVLQICLVDYVSNNYLFTCFTWSLSCSPSFSLFKSDSDSLMLNSSTTVIGFCGGVLVGRF